MEAAPPGQVALAPAPAKAQPAKVRSPPTLSMVVEAVRVLNERKGASAVAIKRYILHAYPGVDPIRLKYYLKGALAKGLEKGQLVRPPNSSAQGATGRFKLAAEKAKAGKGKEKKGPLEGEAEQKQQQKGAKATGPPEKKKKKTAAAAAKGPTEKVKKPKAKGAAVEKKPPRGRSPEGEKTKPPSRAPKTDTGKGKALQQPRPPQAKVPPTAGPKEEGATAKHATKGKPKADTGKGLPPPAPLVERAKGAPGGAAAAKGAKGKLDAGAAKPEKKGGAKGKKGATVSADDGGATKPQAQKTGPKGKTKKAEALDSQDQ